MRYKLNTSIPRAFTLSYGKVYELWNKNLNPTLKINLTCDNSKKVDYNINLGYSETDTKNENGDVVTNIEISVSYPGEVNEKKRGILRRTILSSKGYLPEFYFIQLLEQFNLLYQNFISNTIGKYIIDIEIYCDTDTYTYTAINPLLLYSEQRKVFGTAPTILAGTPSCSGSCNTELCDNITTGQANYESVCNNSNQSGEGGYSCMWVSGSCQVNSNCSCT